MQNSSHIVILSIMRINDQSFLSIRISKMHFILSIFFKMGIFKSISSRPIIISIHGSDILIHFSLVSFFFSVFIFIFCSFYDLSSRMKIIIGLSFIRFWSILILISFNVFSFLFKFVLLFVICLVNELVGFLSKFSFSSLFSL